MNWHELPEPPMFTYTTGDCTELVKKAVLAERQRCARIVLKQDDGTLYSEIARKILEEPK